MLTIRIAEEAADLAVARALFLEYAQSLGFDLSFQDFEREIEDLARAYPAPKGCILLAEDVGEVGGCVAVRPLAEGICEMKRLFVRPAWRGRGAGRALIQAALHEGKARGYGRMRLDTVPGMEAAMALYRACGFQPIEPYRINPIPGTRYFEREL